MGLTFAKGRKEAPAHYILKIDTFSSLASSIYQYESRVFEASGYKWKLLLRPNYVVNNGNAYRRYMSLSLQISEKDNTLPPGWEINAMVCLFIYNHRTDKYSRMYRKLNRFHAIKTDWGFNLPYNAFVNPLDGYLMNNRCVFGVEVFVIKNQGKGETVSVKKEPSILSACTWKIDKFSKLADNCSYSDPFSCGGCEWKLGLYPKGLGKWKEKSVSLFLQVHNHQKLAPGWKMHVKYKLRIRNQVSDKHKEGTYIHKYCAASTGCGPYGFLPLADLNNPTNGYAVEDTLIVEAEIIVFTNVKDFP